MKPVLEPVTKCPSCGGEHFLHVFSSMDHLVSEKPFQIVECSTCNLRMTSPRPTEQDIGMFYKSEQYVSHSSTNKGLVNKLYHIVRAHAIKQKYKLVRSLSQGHRILDIGAGTGDLIAYFRKQGMDVDGIEPEPLARELAKNKHGLHLHDVGHLDHSDASYDVITMWHVLEHIHQPGQLLLKIKNKIRPGGALVVAVPNHRSKDAKIYGNNWAAYDVPRHLFHFNKDDISNLAHSAGLQVEGILPMKFDAYYVSMLSEKNSGGWNMRGVFNGWRSNIAARLKSGEYSSLIYVLRPTGQNKAL